MLIIADFNVKSRKTSHCGLNQIINEPAHILEDSSFWIDLAFTSQSNMVQYIQFSHHQIVFAQFDQKIFYPPPCVWCIWDYKYANTVQVKNALTFFNWERTLCNSSIDKKIYFLNKTIINLMCNYIPNKTNLFDDQNPPEMTRKFL